jgi:hypothetical protein
MANDIFISYAWADNEPPIGSVRPKEERWVWMFEAALSQALGRKGVKRKVWIDRREVKANEHVLPLLERELIASQLLLVLMSPSWTASQWCRRELEAFLSHHPDEGHRSEVFVIELEPVSREQWDERIRTLGAFTFHRDLDGGPERIRLGDPLPDPRLDRDYYSAIQQLARQIHDELPAAPDVPREQPTTGELVSLAPERVVWIAEPTNEALMRKRRELGDAVKRLGFKALMPSLDAMRLSANSLSEQLAAQFGKAGLFVNLLDAESGRLLDDGRSWTHFQLDLSKVHAEREGWPFVAWRDPAVVLADLTDQQQQALLGSVDKPFDAFCRELLQRLPASRALVAPARAESPPSSSVCVTCTAEDESFSDQVLRWLEQLSVSYRVFIGADGRTPTRAEERALQDSAGVVFIYGAADPNWLLSKVQQTAKLRGLRQALWGALIDVPMLGKAPAQSVPAVERHDWSPGPRFDLLEHFLLEVGALSHV